MRFYKDTNRIHIDGNELVYLAQSKLAHGLPSDEEMRLGRHETGGMILSLHADVSGMRFQVNATIHKTEQESVTLHYALPQGMTHPSPEISRQARGEVFVAGHIWAEKHNLDKVTLVIVYYSHNGEYICTEHASESKLSTFFVRLLHTLTLYHAMELDRVCRRLPTMAQVPYPFPALRLGQDDLISEVYGTLCRGKKLYACAPTGIGKTMSMLFPAVRALGGGVFDKIFYFTPKNTIADVAIDGITQLKKAGADLHGIQILAKEKVCPAYTVCREDTFQPCPMTTKRGTRMEEAMTELFDSGEAVITQETLLACATKHQVCPYELSLCYAEICDVVICDYNYLFDLRVYFRRFFSHTGRWCFLVDEAHNLVERARELYSLEITPEKLHDMGEVLSFIPEFASLFHAAAKGLSDMIFTQVKENIQKDKEGIPHGFDWSFSPPTDFFDVLDALSSHVSSLLDGKIDLGDDTPPLTPSQKRQLTRVCFELCHLCELASLFDKGYVTFYELHGHYHALRCLCLDPAPILSCRLALGHSAVLFSATLHPTDYYKAMLGGEKGDATVELPSPFDSNHLCVTVMDKIATGYSSREESLLSVVRVILTTVKAQPGNYMVFCPSFAYLDAISGALKKAVPGLEVKCQTRDMSQKDREQFLEAFSSHNKRALIGFCVMGGIYSEGVDLVGKRLIGAIVVGVGLPSLSNEREAMKTYFEEKYEAGTAYAYTYPGMNRVLQAAGRVIRSEEDRGVVVLIDNRFAEPVYRELMPGFWHGLKYAGDLPALTRRLTQFWHPKDNT